MTLQTKCVDLLLKTTLVHKKVRMNREIYRQTPRAIYTEQGPNNKHRDVTLSHAHATPATCHEICKDLQLRGEMIHMID